LRDAGGAWSEKTLEAAQNAAAVASYRLEHDISLNPADSFEQNEYEMYFSDVSVYTSAKSSFWNAAVGSVSLLALVGVFAIVLAGTTVSSEFSSGTVKFLLMSPVKRWKILFAKYATVIFISLGMAALVGTVSLSVALFFGFGEAFLPAVYASGGEVYTLSPYLLLLRDYGFEMVEITVMLTMAFAISTLTRKSAMAIGVTVFASFMGSALSGFLQMFGIDAGRYLLFSNLDLGAIVNETALYPHQSLLEAITVIALHMLVFLLVAHDAFVRREV